MGMTIDCVSRAEVLKLMQDNWRTHNGDWAMQESMDDIRALPSVTPQEPITWIVGKNNAQIAVKNMPIDKLQKICAIIGDEQEPNIKALGEELRKVREGIKDEKVLIGFNMAVAISNKHLGGIEDKAESEPQESED